MSDAKWPLPDSRILGVQEHYERIQTFLELADESKEPIVIFRLQVACIYFARGIMELIFEAAELKQLSLSREQLKNSFCEKVRWFNLIEKIRRHDFHRFGIIPPNSNHKEIFLGGPIELTASKGFAAYSIQPTGLKKEFTGNSSIKDKKTRPLISVDGHFYDDDTKKYVSMGQILKDVVVDIPVVIDEFKQCLRV